jgi:DNA-binding response OmpR family regulator
MVLLDIMMPGLDGWAVFDALRDDERTRDLPVIFLTARAELRDQFRGMDMGAIDYVTKPFNPIELPFIVMDVLARLERDEGDQMRQERLAELRDLIGAS